MHTCEPKAEVKRQHPCSRSRLVRDGPDPTSPGGDHGSHWAYWCRCALRYPSLGHGAWLLPLLKHDTVGLIQYVTFPECLLSVSDMCLRLIHVSLRLDTYLFQHWLIFHCWMYHI
jgi:hypothetical protein